MKLTAFWKTLLKKAACLSNRRKIKYYFSGRLNYLQRMRLSGHMSLCEACRREYIKYSLLQERLEDLNPSIEKNDDYLIEIRIAVEKEKLRRSG